MHTHTYAHARTHTHLMPTAQVYIQIFTQAYQIQTPSIDPLENNLKGYKSYNT